MSMDNGGGMMLTGENRRTGRKPCPSATLSTTNPKWTVALRDVNREGKLSPYRLESSHLCGSVNTFLFVYLTTARRATELLKLRLQNSRLDSATFHTTHASFETVREFFGDRVISRGLWPLRFRDITPSDLFVGKFKRQSF
jgi:hypothetical protein